MLLRIRPAGRILEEAVGQAEFLRLLVHQFGELLFGSSNRFGKHNTGVIARLHDDTTNQVLDFHLRANLHEHLRAAHLPGSLGDRQLVFKPHLALLQPLIDQVDRHQLGHRGRRHLNIGILFQQRRAGVVVHDIGPSRQGIDRADRRVGRATS